MKVSFHRVLAAHETTLSYQKIVLLTSSIIVTDLNTRMPRSEAQSIFDLIKPIGMDPVSFSQDTINHRPLTLPSTRHRLQTVYRDHGKLQTVGVYRRLVPYSL